MSRGADAGKSVGAGPATNALAPDPGAAPVARDYFIAQSASAELLWVFRERPTARQGGAAGTARWFLHGRDA